MPEEEEEGAPRRNVREALRDAANPRRDLIPAAWQEVDYHWRLFEQPKFKQRLLNKLSDAWMTADERFSYWAGKMDFLIEQKWHTLWRRKIFSVVRGATEEYLLHGMLRPQQRGNRGNGESGEDDALSANHVRAQLVDELRTAGLPSAWVAQPRNEYEARYNHTYASYVDALRRSDLGFVLRNREIEHHVKHLWKMARYAWAAKDSSRASVSSLRRRTTMGHRVYTRISARIYMHFLPGISSHMAHRVSELMWPFDCGWEGFVEADEITMDSGHFYDFLIDIACSWCGTSTAREFVQFLRSVSRLVLPPDSEGALAALRYQEKMAKLRRKGRGATPDSPEKTGSETEAKPGRAEGAGRTRKGPRRCERGFCSSTPRRSTPSTGCCPPPCPRTPPPRRRKQRRRRRRQPPPPRTPRQSQRRTTRGPARMRRRGTGTAAARPRATSDTCGRCSRCSAAGRGRAWPAAVSPRRGACRRTAATAATTTTTATTGGGRAWRASPPSSAARARPSASPARGRSGTPGPRMRRRRTGSEASWGCAER